MNVRPICLVILSCFAAMFASAISQAEEPSGPMKILLEAVPRCWVIPAGGWAAGVVEVRFQLNKDGSLIGDPMVIAPPAEELAPEVERSALNAIRTCAPFRELSKFGD